MLNRTPPLPPEQPRARLNDFLRVYWSHARIGIPLVLAGSAYIAFHLQIGASFMWLGSLAAILAPVPMALSELKLASPQPQPDKLAQQQAHNAQLKAIEQTAASVENEQ